jgi:beta-phosphoglucomutase
MLNREFRLRAVLFDLDGVVLKSMDQHLQAWQYAFSQVGLKISKQEFYALEGRGVRSVVDELAKRYNLNADLKPKIIKTKMDYYNQIYKPEFYTGLFELLDLLKMKHIKSAIISGANRARIDDLLAHHLQGFFEVTVSCDDVTDTKPYPEPYLKGAALLQVNPVDCIVIENAPLGIRSARDAGMTVIAVRTTLEDEYLRQADYIVDDIPQVTKLLVDSFL